MKCKCNFQVEFGFQAVWIWSKQITYTRRKRTSQCWNGEADPWDVIWMVGLDICNFQRYFQCPWGQYPKNQVIFEDDSRMIEHVQNPLVLRVRKRRHRFFQAFERPTVKKTCACTEAPGCFPGTWGRTTLGSFCSQLFFVVVHFLVHFGISSFCWDTNHLVVLLPVLPVLGRLRLRRGLRAPGGLDGVRLRGPGDDAGEARWSHRPSVWENPGLFDGEKKSEKAMKDLFIVFVKISLVFSDVILGYHQLRSTVGMLTKVICWHFGCLSGAKDMHLSQIHCHFLCRCFHGDDRILWFLFLDSFQGPELKVADQRLVNTGPLQSSMAPLKSTRALLGQRPTVLLPPSNFVELSEVGGWVEVVGCWMIPDCPCETICCSKTREVVIHWSMEVATSRKQGTMVRDILLCSGP